MTAAPLVQLSLELPQVSGLYRLLTPLLRALTATGALDCDGDEEGEEKEGEGMEVDEAEDEEDALSLNQEAATGGRQQQQRTQQQRQGSGLLLLSAREARALSRLLGHYLGRMVGRVDQFQVRYTIRFGFHCISTSRIVVD